MLEGWRTRFASGFGQRVRDCALNDQAAHSGVKKTVREVRKVGAGVAEGKLAFDRLSGECRNFAAVLWLGGRGSIRVYQIRD